MKVNCSSIALVGYVVLLLMACSQVSDPTPADEILPTSAETLPIGDVQTESTSTLPTQKPGKDVTPITQPTQSPPSSGLESLIEKTKEDLAQRLSISVAQIDLVEARDVVWPDVSLGCPQPGMMYAQVLTPGFLIQFEIAEQVYSYHTDVDKMVILCESVPEENSAKKVIDKNVDDGWPNETKDNDVIIITPTK